MKLSNRLYKKIIKNEMKKMYPGLDKEKRKKTIPVFLNCAAAFSLFFFFSLLLNASSLEKLKSDICKVDKDKFVSLIITIKQAKELI